MKEITDAASLLMAEGKDILEKASIEWKHSLSLRLKALGSSKTIDLEGLPPSDWIGFRQMYEQWYRSCIGLMEKRHFSGIDDFMKLYQEDHSDLPSIRTALLLGFSPESHDGFTDRVENQIAILTSLESEIKLGLNDQTRRILFQSNMPYVDPGRINELRSITSQKFDLSKLTELCEELTRCDADESLLAVTILTRAILDHVPPIFGYNSFSEVANNYGSGSFKKSMQHLQNSLRNIADAYLHTHIRNKESLPTRTQVNFSNDLDVLLAEIIRLLK